MNYTFIKGCQANLKCLVLKDEIMRSTSRQRKHPSTPLHKGSITFSWIAKVLGGPSGKTLISSWRVPHNLSSSHWSGWNVPPRVLCWRLDLQPVLSRGHGAFQRWDLGKAANSRRSCSWRLRVLPSVQKALWSLWVEKLCSNIRHSLSIHASLWFQSRDSSHRGAKPLRTSAHINCFSSSDFLGICHGHRKLA